jgi:hypothetical protein
VSKRYVLSEYVELAMGQALYDKLEDNSFLGRIPPCPGVLSFARRSKNVKRSSGPRLRIGFLSASNFAIIYLL